MRAVSLFQTKYNIVTSGTPATTGFGAVGPKTRTFLNKLISSGAFPSLLQCLQSLPSSKTASANTQKYFFACSLTVGSNGADVEQLQIFLNEHGYVVAQTGNGSPGHETTYFGPATRSALVQFQNAYAAEILAPLGLSQATGYFGSGTIKVINAMNQ